MTNAIKSLKTRKEWLGQTWQQRHLPPSQPSHPRRQERLKLSLFIPPYSCAILHLRRTLRHPRPPECLGALGVHCRRRERGETRHFSIVKCGDFNLRECVSCVVFMPCLSSFSMTYFLPFSRLPLSAHGFKGQGVNVKGGGYLHLRDNSDIFTWMWVLHVRDNNNNSFFQL